MVKVLCGIGIYLIAISLFIYWWHRHMERVKATPYPPECCGSAPGPQARAENDCDHCPFRSLCDTISYGSNFERTEQ
jgi:hypothetical protein